MATLRGRLVELDRLDGGVVPAAQQRVGHPERQVLAGLRWRGARGLA